ncbi:discoidin domain-containing protein [Novipirellula sp.]|uniref:DUF7133 domain-containing protein n=1 Tax=Novipirellula sp. TaxID=2795430 RepID=UPI0035693621
MRLILQICGLLLFSISNPVAFVIAEEVSSKAPPLSPAESIATMKIQPGYRLVPVLVEPEIEEPVAAVWDGNGRMYVIEMRTYMQDIDGKNQLKPTSRVSRHEDTDDDGIYDKHTVFADNLSLPRMVLPLLDRVIIAETNTLDLKSYQDTDDDGVADRIEMWCERGRVGNNLEHQTSGLIWNIDNWIYATYTHERIRFTDGKVIREPLPHGSGQWGLTHDDEGRIFYSTAGGENPAMDFQRPIVYGKLSLRGEQADGFREVFPIDNVPDVQGGPKRLRDDNTLTVFSACCGQSVYRGDRMPADFQGDLLIPEPVGRLVRRAKVTNDQGRVVVSNAYDRSEFIAATDPNFRPVNSATGPDGCLYIVDMYRGIIQEGNWVREGSYLREVVKEYELEKNIGRGRIYRVDHQTTQRGPQPRMLDETPAELVAHLSHPNGWWRSEAQKLIVLHGDRSVVPTLETMATTHENPLARLHAMWTLEGLDAVKPALLIEALADTDWRVRSAALRIAEPRMATDRSLDNAIEKLMDDESPDVLIQMMLSIGHGRHPQAAALTEQIVASHIQNSAISELHRQIVANREEALAEQRKLEELRRRNRALAESVERGAVTYKTLCTECHGADGRGQHSADNRDLVLAPPLAGSARVLGHKERLTRILLHGLVGPVDDKTYAAGLMLPMGAHDDRWVADVANFIRNQWGNKASLIQQADVARIRAYSSGRIGPWTLAELNYFDPAELDRNQWMITASHNAKNVSAAIDGKAKTRWDTATYQKPGMWFAVEFPKPIRLMSLHLDTQASRADYPRQFVVHVSVDGKDWGDPVANGVGDGPITVVELDCPEPVKHVRIAQTGKAPKNYWSIHELSIKGMSADAKPTESLAQTLADADPDQLAAEARAHGDPRAGAVLFYNPALSCANCHDPANGPRLAPDLASLRDGVTDRFLVESVLTPSKDIRKEYSQWMVLTVDGVSLMGFKQSESDETLVLSDPASGKLIPIAQDDIEFSKLSTLSAMPAGLVNPLASKQQFLDLVRFLMEINGGGEESLQTMTSGIRPAKGNATTH